MKKETYTEQEEADIIERLIPIYEKKIEENIRWDYVEKQCKEYSAEEDGETIGFCLLGSVFEIMPSGKYWTWWAYGNTSQHERIKDTAYSEALEKVASNHHYWIQSGEGDACDLFICKSIETATETEE